MPAKKAAAPKKSAKKAAAPKAPSTNEILAKDLHACCERYAYSHNMSEVCHFMREVADFIKRS